VRACSQGEFKPHQFEHTDKRAAHLSKAQPSIEGDCRCLSRGRIEDQRAKSTVPRPIDDRLGELRSDPAPPSLRRNAEAANFRHIPTLLPPCGNRETSEPRHLCAAAPNSDHPYHCACLLMPGRYSDPEGEVRLFDRIEAVCRRSKGHPAITSALGLRGAGIHRLHLCLVLRPEWVHPFVQRLDVRQVADPVRTDLYPITPKIHLGDTSYCSRSTRGWSHPRRRKAAM
jgi:hypothetical protein